MNRLGKAASPYLRTAAHQPVPWREFGPEAFAAARAEGKPVLLDVGAVWCHWCHVMDRESYDDPETARVIAERFVAVKVDRDERPDVDARYQKAVQAMTGQGGWPLTAFLLPDGRCFYGGTYFPPQERHGRPAFRDVLVAVSDFFAKENAQALRQAEELAKALAPRPSARPGVVDVRMLAEAERTLLDHADPVNGGWGDAPKFPHTSAVGFALLRHARTGAGALRDVALDCLRGMSRGGVRDHVGGGYHRYSTDARWIVPHFEKMLYDNAELLRNHVHAWQLTGDRAHADVAAGTLAFLEGVLGEEGGAGYGASQDADLAAWPAGAPAPGHGPAIDDGSYFTWTRDEVETALPPDLARVATLAFGVGEPASEVHMTPGRHVLFRAADDDAIAAALRVPLGDVAARVRDAKAGLAAARARRDAPFVDRTVYVAWNAMAVSAALEAASCLPGGGAATRAYALRTLDLLARAVDPARGAPHRVGAAGGDVWGLLDDQVQLAWAATEAYVQTGEARHLDLARTLVAVLERDFADPRGGYADTAASARAGAAAAPLAEPESGIGDQPTPSANAMAARLHLRLALATGDEAHRARAEAILQAFAHDARRFGLFAGTYFEAAATLVDPPAHVTVVATASDARGEALLAAARGAYSPGKVVVRVEPGGDASPLPAEVRGMVARAGPGPLAFVCRGASCAPPTDDPSQVAQLVRNPQGGTGDVVPRE